MVNRLHVIPRDACCFDSNGKVICTRAQRQAGSACGAQRWKVDLDALVLD